jgi:HEAT repeat protein
LLNNLTAQTIDEIDPYVLARLRQQIENGSVEIKRSALSEIRNLESPSASRAAVPALGDKDPIVRATAASSVVYLPKNEAATALIPLLSDRDEFVRREAAYALGRVRDASAVTTLLRLAGSDKISEVRSAAAIALGGIGAPSAISGLVSILKTRPREEAEFLRRSIARSIGQIAQADATGETDVVTPQNFLPEKFKDIDPENAPTRRAGFEVAVDVLIGVLRNSAESDDTRREAAFALGAIGDPKALSLLQSSVSSPDPYLAEIAREALLKLHRRNQR